MDSPQATLHVRGLGDGNLSASVSSVPITPKNFVLYIPQLMKLRPGQHL